MPVGVFSARDLRLRAGDLLREAESGRLSLITKYGRPAVLAVPFGDRLLEHGVSIYLALELFESGLLTLASAAKLAGTSLEEFLDLLSTAGIDAVDYPAEELEKEAEAAGVSGG